MLAVATMARTLAFAFGLKSAFGVPVVGSSATIRLWAVPLTVVKSPPT